MGSYKKLLISSSTLQPTYQLLDPRRTLCSMAHGHLNLGISVADHTPTTTSSLAKGRMAQALCNGLALSLEILILALLLSFRLVELGGSPGHCTATWSDKELPFGVFSFHPLPRYHRSIRQTAQM